MQITIEETAMTKPEGDPTDLLRDYAFPLKAAGVIIRDADGRYIAESTSGIDDDGRRALIRFLVDAANAAHGGTAVAENDLTLRERVARRIAGWAGNSFGDPPGIVIAEHDKEKYRQRADEIIALFRDPTGATHERE